MTGSRRGGRELDHRWGSTKETTTSCGFCPGEDAGLGRIKAGLGRIKQGQGQRGAEPTTGTTPVVL